MIVEDSLLCATFSQHLQEDNEGSQQASQAQASQKSVASQRGSQKKQPASQSSAVPNRQVASELSKSASPPLSGVVAFVDVAEDSQRQALSEALASIGATVCSSGKSKIK